MSEFRFPVRDSDDRRRIHGAERDGVAMTREEVLDAWARQAGFREAFLETLREAPFEAYFFETPAWTRGTVDRDFEFVLVDAPSLVGLRMDPHPFASQFAASAGPIARFSSLGGDAELFAPTPAPSVDATHLAAFVRSAEAGPNQALWTTAATALRERLDESPRWLSTSGLGVSWLHLRLDTRPKYYTHRPYRRAPGDE